MQAFIVSEPGPVTERIRTVLTRAGCVCPVANILPPDEAAVVFPGEPELVVVVLGSNPEQAIALVGRLPVSKSCSVVVVGPAIDSQLVLQAIHAGAADFVDDHKLEDGLASAVERFRSVEGRHAQPARTIVVLAPSGGAGSSTVAVNVAVALADAHKRAMLLDLNLHSGDATALLDLRPAHDLAELCQNLPHMDRTMLVRSLARHASGVELLAAPRAFADGQYVTADAVRQVMNLARSTFPYVVVDADNTFAPEQLQAIRQADVILLVIRLDFACLRNTRRVLDYLDQFGISREKVRVVANHYGQYCEVSVDKAETALGIKIGHFIPEDPKTVNRATNDGVPVIRESPSARVSKTLLTLAASMNGRKHA